MKKAILTIAMAFALALPFVETADAYGERWYMVKTPTHLSGWGDKGRKGCFMNKGDRFERDQRYQVGRWMYGRAVGKPIWCKGHIKHSRVYNMDTVIDNLSVYRRNSRGSRNFLNLWRNEASVMEEYRAWQNGRSLPHHAHSKACYRGVFEGSKIHVFADKFNGAAKILVLDGPCKGKEGWILSYTIKR